MFTFEQFILAFVTVVVAFVLGIFVYVSKDKKDRLSIDRTMLVMFMLPILSVMFIFAVVYFLVS